MRYINTIDEFQELESHYFATTCGRIYTTKKNVKQLTSMTGTGYSCVKLKIKREKRYRSLQSHVIIAKAFVSGFTKGSVVNHIDHIKTNNHIFNLEWVKAGENVGKWHKMNTNLEYLLNQRDFLLKKLSSIESKIKNVETKTI